LITQDWRKESRRMARGLWGSVRSVRSSKQHTGSLFRPAGRCQCLCSI